MLYYALYTIQYIIYYTYYIYYILHSSSRMLPKFYEKKKVTEQIKNISHIYISDLTYNTEKSFNIKYWGFILVKI